MAAAPIADATTVRTMRLKDFLSVGSYLENIVEDTTPQLGGDLDLNGKSIDFPTTADISDCLDEDNMVSDSATMLATQQSIKAYVDAKTVDMPINIAINNMPLTLFLII